MLKTPCNPDNDPPPEAHDFMVEITGAEHAFALNLFRKLKVVSHLLGYIAYENHRDISLSPERMRILTILAVHTRLGHTSGISPSRLSRSLGVSRNTTSSLLKGLEEQRLVERHLNPDDRRRFNIQITPIGYELILTHAPEFGAFTMELFAVLTPDEQQTLLALLEKMHAHLAVKATEMGLHAHYPDSD
ncbi:MAG: MarR family transcriptional regulator [Anaerolineae bacterium]|nr:MarR family transcriptional regulator [Anaerolineae bacterium]